MIEIEKKFLLTDENIARLTDNAEFLGEKSFTDIYYDTDDLRLTSKDRWLRTRDGVWELKLPLHTSTERVADQFEELTTEEEIRKAIELPATHSFADDLTTAGYKPFYRGTTTRKKYKNGEFIIDLDTVTFDTFTYSLGEIELLITDQTEMQHAVNKIIAFASECGLTIGPVRGKVNEYLKRVRPEHYAQLIACGVIRNDA